MGPPVIVLIINVLHTVHIVVSALIHLLTCTLGARLVHKDIFLSLGVAINMTGRDSLEAMKSFLISV